MLAPVYDGVFQLTAARRRLGRRLNHDRPPPEEPAIIEYDPVADEAIQPASDAAYHVDPETGEVLDSAAIPETQEGELLL